MPELPEVETAKRGLAPAMEGATIVSMDVNRPNLRFPFPQDFAARMIGQKILSVGRRAKYILVALASNEVLIMHLGMSGSFHVEEIDDARELQVDLHHQRNRIATHDHVVFHLECNNKKYRVIYNDPRRFGFMDLIGGVNLNDHKYLCNLGIEPTGNTLDGEKISQLFTGRKAPLKAALLDQKLIAGLGNIYVCEALWQSGLSPKRMAKTICAKSGKATRRATTLATAIRDVISRAIEAGGSSLNDHRQTDGTLGYFQHRFNVYDREGENCNKPDCKGTIKRIVQSGRATFYCTKCQR